MIFKYIVGAALASGQVSGACIPYGSDPLAGNTFRGTDNGYEYTVNFGVGGTYLQKVLSTGGTYKVGNYDKLTGNVASFIQGDWCASINNYRSGTVTFEQDCSKSSLQLKSVGEPSICVYAMTPFNLEANCDANQKANCNSNSTTNPTANKQANCYANPNPYTHSNLKPNYATNIEPLNLEANCDANQKPTAIPTAQPTPLPTNKPTAMPTPIPTPIPTSNPTMPPTLSPSTLKPTAMPTKKPTAIPTAQPTPLPTSKPTAMPTPIPTPIPTSNPTMPPTLSPSTLKPTAMPTKKPTSIPTAQPTPLPTSKPTAMPTQIPTPIPTSYPTRLPTLSPSTLKPTVLPTKMPTELPTMSPTSMPTRNPTAMPTLQPTSQTPSGEPSIPPSVLRSTSPSQSSVPSVSPSLSPTENPSLAPSISALPSHTPSQTPTSSPSHTPFTLINPFTFSIPFTICHALIGTIPVIVALKHPVADSHSTSITYSISLAKHKPITIIGAIIIVALKHPVADSHSTSITSSISLAKHKPITIIGAIIYSITFTLHKSVIHTVNVSFAFRHPISHSYRTSVRSSISGTKHKPFTLIIAFTNTISVTISDIIIGTIPIMVTFRHPFKSPFSSSITFTVTFAKHKSFPLISAFASPTLLPSQSSIPSYFPSGAPTVISSLLPSKSSLPSHLPSQTPTSLPSLSPSVWPSVSPSQSLGPSLSPTFLPTISPTTVPSLSSVPSLSPSIDPTVTPSSVPSSSPSIVEQTVIVPGSFSISTDICSLSEGQQYVLASASRKTIQEITCVNLSSCAVNIESVCGNNFMDKNRLLHLHTSRGLQAASWQIYYQVTYVFTCVTASCDSSKDKATSSTIISTVSDRVTFALSSGSFATVLSNNIKSGTSNFEFITSTCLVVWGVVGTPTMIDGPNQYNGTGFYYPDWDGGSGTCLQDGQAPLYMQKNPLYWMYANLEECCDRYFGGWNKNKCMNQQGSGLWYVNYALGKCVIDCDEVNGPLCGGLATSTEDDLFSDPLSCCESKLPWVAKTSCEAESFSSNCYCGTGKWYRGDKAGSNVCVRDCNKECGDDTCGGIVVDSFIALHNNVDECCKSEYNWIEGNLCSVKSMKSSEDDYWWPDMSNSKCIKGSDAPIMDLSVQLYSTVEACCVSGISWLSKSACVAASNKSTPQGSGKYFVDWVRTICKQDTGVDENVANSWDEQFDDMESCCDQIWSQSSHTFGRLQDKGCKCVRRNDNNNVRKCCPETYPIWETGDSNVENYKDLVGYGLSAPSHPDSGRRCNSQVDSTMDKETNPTEESGVSNEHLLGVEDGGEWEVEFDGLHVTQSN
ncbi:hypothetical protein HJC23_010801 [Cyclotella cryptica]|uniref:Uncharacterized protein n=1 Tax=Cyclotella cryptica TaxID=29204 RepID=A0ABD3QNS8_9STRA